MSWTAPSLSDPTNVNAWTGSCSQLDMLTATPPTEPGDFDDIPDYGFVTDYTDDLLMLEGFEWPAAMYTSATGILWGNTFPSTSGISMSTSTRSGTTTGGHSLQMAATDVNGSRCDYYKAPVQSEYQYVRMYINITSWTNTNGSLRGNALFGWVGGSGFRSYCGVVFPANGGLPKLSISHGVPGLSGSATAAAALSLNTWYRIELVTESKAAVFGMTTTMKYFLGDSTTAIETLTCADFGSAAGGFLFFGTDSCQSGNAITILFDDMRAQTSKLISGNTPAHGPFLGPGGIWMMYPRAAGDSTAWSPLSGTNFSNVDESPIAVPDNDTSYITGTGTPTLLDTYRVAFYPSANFPTTLKKINVVMVHQSQKGVSGTARIINAAYMDPLGTIFSGLNYTSSGALYQAGSYVYLIYEGGLRVEFAPTQQIGTYWTTSGSASVHRVTAVWGLMDISD